MRVIAIRTANDVEKWFRYIFVFVWFVVMFSAGCFFFFCFCFIFQSNVLCVSGAFSFSMIESDDSFFSFLSL